VFERHLPVEQVGTDGHLRPVHRQLMEIYADAQRNSIGANFHQLPVNRPKVPVNTYLFDGQMAFEHSGAAPI
jgi:catalase